MRKLLVILLFPFTSFGQVSIGFGFEAALNCSPNDASAIGFNDNVFTEGRLYLFVVMTTGTTNPGTVSATSLTWTSVISTGNSTRRIQVFRCMPSSTTAGTEDVAIGTFGGGSTGYAASLIEITGVLTTGTNGADAIVQSVAGGTTGTDPSITMAALSASGRNAVISYWYNNANTFGGTPESGWIEQVDCGSDPPTAGGYLMYRYLTTDNTPTVTAASSDWIGVAIELASSGRRIFNIN